MNATTSSIDEPRLQQIREQGFATIDALFEASELEALEAVADRAVAHHNRDYEHPENLYQYVTRRNAITFVNELADDSGLVSPLREFATQPRIRDLARAVAGPGAAHHCYQLVYKHPQFPNPFPWHQDHIHTPADGLFYNLWIALSDMTVENGCIRVMPGVGLDGILPYHETPYGHSCWPLEAEAQGVPIVLKRGSALLLTSKTLHMSGGNGTDGTRKAMLMVFMDRARRVGDEPIRLLEYPDGEVRA